MIQFNKPQNLNGAELLNELKASGVVVTGLPLIDENGEFWLNIKDADKTKATPIVAAHNGTTVAPDNTAAKATAQAKLAALGLTADEIAALLG
jgi:hypothetical protein